MSQKLSDIEREIREEERRKRRKKRRKRRQNRVQPIMEPMSSNLAAINARRMEELEKRQRLPSDSSEQNIATAHAVDLALGRTNFPMQSLGSSNILSDTGVSENSNSISEIELPQRKPKLPDFSMFTVSTAQQQTGKEDNSNVTGNTANLKGTNPSPSGSVRRGRRREVKLEMTETSFYQEDDENIEIGGNQTVHAEENCHEMTEVKANLKELGPLVNEIFEQAKANSAAGRNGKQRDPMGSSRLGSASSRGSRSSRGSQAGSKDVKYANTKVNLPPERPRADTDRTSCKRPFSGDYILASRKNSSKRDESARKSQSQPSSRVSSATAEHKRQIGNNGKMDFSDGLSWSRFLQSKGYNSGPMFGPIGMLPKSEKCQCDIFNTAFMQDNGTFMNMTLKDQSPYFGHSQRQGPFPGQLQLTDKSHVENQDSTVNPDPKPPSPVNVLNVEQEHKHLYEIKRPYTNPYRKHRDPSEGDVLGNIPDEPVAASENGTTGESDNGLNILNIEAEHSSEGLSHRNALGTADILDVAAEQLLSQQSEVTEKPGDLRVNDKALVNVDVLHVESEQANNMDQPHIIVHRTDCSDDHNLVNSDNEAEGRVSPVYAKPQKRSKKKNDKDAEEKHVKVAEQKYDNVMDKGIAENDYNNTDVKPKSPREVVTTQNLDQRNLSPVSNPGVFREGMSHKVSAFDGQGPKKMKKVPQANFVLNDSSKQNSAVVLTKPLTGLKPNHTGGTREASSGKKPTELKQNGVVGRKPAKPITLGGKQSAKKVQKQDSDLPNGDTNRPNAPLPPRSIGSDGMGSSGSRSLSAVTRSSGASSNSKKSEQGIGALNLGFINDIYSKHNKEKGSSKSKVVPERSVGMFDFVDCDNFESEYDDVSTDNLTDTYTYTDYDDDLTEVSSLPC